MVSDETAYRKYLAGDEAAAQLLVERYGDALTLYINGVLGDIHEAEDLMIEAFAHIFARERPIQDGCFKAYLYKTGRNLALRCKTRRRVFFGRGGGPLLLVGGAAFLLFFCQRSWRSVSAFSFRKPLSHAPVAG